MLKCHLSRHAEMSVKILTASSAVQSANAGTYQSPPFVITLVLFVLPFYPGLIFTRARPLQVLPFSLSGQRRRPRLCYVRHMYRRLRQSEVAITAAATSSLPFATALPCVLLF